MYKYKTEMHCHTQESSVRCGKIPAKEVVNAYIDAGYNTLIITDHFGGKHVSDKGAEYDLNKFFEGFNLAKKDAGNRINIILGMEINLSENANDYLIYGLTEDFIRENHEMYKMGIEKFCQFAHENGLLVYQAHPFRNWMSVIYPSFLDGIESFNAHPRHDSRNSIAGAWAELYNMRTISGSDAHQIPDLARGGIMTPTEIKNSQDLLTVLNSCDYNLITV